MLRTLVRKTRHEFRAFVLKGNTYYCPLCGGNYSKFIDKQVCPGCGSYARHRVLWLYLLHLVQAGRMKLQGRLLHVAPEACLARRLKTSFDYLSVDQETGHAMEVADITRLPFQNGSFDAVVCNHVLEHVDDDRKAMAELGRVLKPGGWASLQVPMRGDALTDEDPAVIDPQERLRRFGQEDHVRLYGTDYPQRLEQAGFSVEVVMSADFLSKEKADKCQVMTDPVIIAWKAASDGGDA